jgi:hypothetical protein
VTKLKLSIAKPLAQRVELIELPEARGEEGEPIVVRCEALKPLDAIRVMKQLPGEVPRLGPKADSVDPEKMEPVLLLCQHLVEQGSALAAPTGELVRPAFWFDPALQRHELSLDGNQLSVADIVAMGTTIMRLSGFQEGAAKKSFPDRKRG